MDPAQVPTVTVQPKVKPKARVPDAVKLGLLFFTLSSSLVLLAYPHIGQTTGASPSFWLLLISGMAMVILTGLFFIYINQLNMGFGKTALVLAFGYNAVIVMIKFFLSPLALYMSNRQADFSTLAGNANTPFFYLPATIGVLLLYLLVFKLLYKHFIKRADKRNSVVRVKKTKSKSVKKVVLIVLLVGFLMVSGGIFAFLLVFGLTFGSSVAYLGYIFGILGFPLLVALGLALVLAYLSFAAVEKQVIVTGNSLLLANFMWVGIALVLLYHVLWVIFMVTLVQIWPFKTYTPK